MRILNVLLIILFTVIVTPAHAADAADGTPVDASEALGAEKSGDADYEQRLELARKMHALNPVRDQINAAIDQVAISQPESQRESFREAMRNALNYKAIEKISVDAMADTYTLQELQTMVEYNSKPEVQSAAKKEVQWAQKVYPEITRMLDQAMMRVRTGAQ